MSDETFKTLTEIGLENWQAEFVIQKFKEGMRSWKLQGQPAPWFILALQFLEMGEEITPKRMKGFTEAHTDGPDPFFA